MKKLFTLLFSLVATTALWAEDFEVDGIYYNILTGREVAVTYRGSSYDSYSNEYTGSVTIPSTVTRNRITYRVTSIGTEAFEACKSLTSVTIGNSVTSIGESAFAGCSSLTSITIPNSVTSIGDWAFYGCSGLTSITIPNSVTSIGGYAFYGCSDLTSVTIGNSVTSIGGGAFYNTGIYNNESNWENGVLYISNCLIEAKDDISGAYIIKEGTRLIGEFAFAGCTGLTSITIPNSVTSIEYSAFYGCSGLTSVTIPNSVTSIGDHAFYDCSGLTSITIPNSVTSIGIYAFSGCSGLTSITIGNSVTSIGDGAFYECSRLTSVTIPNSVTSIGDHAFYDCSGLTSVTIGNSVTSIGSSAFSGCSGLTSITIPNSVTSIGYQAFSECSGLTSITIPNSVTSIGVLAFYNCYRLTSVTIGNSVTSIENSAFKNCSNLKKIYLEPTTPPSLGYNVFNSKPEAYVPWSSLEVYADSEWKDYVSEFKVFIHYSGVLDNGITWKYDNGKLLISGNGALIYQRAPWTSLIDSIQSIEMINGITSISESAFANYKKLTKVTLPASLEEIGANAFYNCPRLYEIYSYASLPPIAQQSSFYNYNADVYVPCEVLSFYKKDMVFSLFPNLQCISSDEVPTDDVVINTGSTDVTIIWPTEENADTYSIVIKKDGKVVCTLTFNSEGQLLNIAFAPGREGNHPAQYAEATTNGYRFTVTGLEEGTDYTYTVTSKDAANKTISEHSGEFTTNSATALDNTHSQSTNCQKILRDGQLLIIRDGKTYNAQGVEL